MEYWVQEYIRLNAASDMDRGLLEHIKPIVSYLNAYAVKNNRLDKT